jgi:hypothetical protein
MRMISVKLLLKQKSEKARKELQDWDKNWHAQMITSRHKNDF